MKSWKVWLLVLALFASGLVAGAFGMRAYVFRQLPLMLAQPMGLEDRVLALIDHEVGLSPAQRDEIRPLIATGVARVEKTHRAVRAEMDAAFSQMDEAIALRLDQGQRAKFAELRARLEKFRRGMPPGPPPGMPPFGPHPGPPPGLHLGPPPGFGPPSQP